MKSASPYRLQRVPAIRTRRVGGVVTAAAAGLMLLVGSTNADTPGQTFVFDWTETMGGAVGLTGMVDLTLGAASTETGFFDISSFDVTSKGGFCGVCTPQTENVSGILFDATTNGVVGDITGSYVNGKGKTHTFTLTTTDQPAGTWMFMDAGPGGTTTMSMGTYTTSAAVTSADEPATIFLLIPAAAGLALALRRRRKGPED